MIRSPDSGLPPTCSAWAFIYNRLLPAALNTLTQLRRGEAYWIQAETAAIWRHPDAEPLMVIDINAGEFVGGLLPLAP